MSATEVVRTTGISWVSVTSITVPIIACLIAVATYLASRADKREQANRIAQEKTELSIKTAVDNLATVLLEKLETKETVNQLRIEMAHLSEQVRQVHEAATTPTGSGM